MKAIERSYRWMALSALWSIAAEVADYRILALLFWFNALVAGAMTILWTIEEWRGHE